MYLNSALSSEAFAAEEVKSGCCYALQSSEDDLWYRVRAIDPYPSDLHSIDFVDFGNRELVSRSRLRHLPEAFCHLPAQAIPRRLKGVEDAFPGIAIFRFVRAAQRYLDQTFICQVSTDGGEMREVRPSKSLAPSFSLKTEMKMIYTYIM